jgi:hypothetical protein
VRLVLGDADRAVLRVIELLQHDDMTSAVENDDRHGPIVFYRLGLGGRHHFLGRIETNRRTVGRCRWRRWRRRLLGDGRNNSTYAEYGCNNKRSKLEHDGSASGAEPSPRFCSPPRQALELWHGSGP